MSEIKLTRGQVALVDDDDFDWLNSMSWYALLRSDKSTYYAQTNIVLPDKRRIGTGMHRVVMGLTSNDHTWVDHVNLNTLDNRRSNLRLCSVAQNSFNRTKQKNNKSGYKGVNWVAKRRKYQVAITVNRRVHFLGYFDDPTEGYRVYCEAARVHHGEFARTD